MEKQVKLHIDTELWHRAKIAAAKAGITLKQLCTQGIRLEVEVQEKLDKET